MASTQSLKLILLGLFGVLFAVWLVSGSLTLFDAVMVSGDVIVAVAVIRAGSQVLRLA